MTEPLRPAEVVRRAATYLDRHGVQSPTATAELLLASVLETDRSELYRRNEGLTGVQARVFGRALCRRCGGTPVQHITGEAGFRRLVLKVRPGVFVPRPETEIVAQVAMSSLDRSGTGPAVVVDVGTGTGAIALSIKDERPGVRVIAIDNSSQAVALAQENAASLGIDIEVLLGDGLGPLPKPLLGRLDTIVSNPPYLARESASSLPSEVLADPDSALFGDIGTYRALFEEAWIWLRPGGAVVVEIDSDIRRQVQAEASVVGFTSIAVEPDLTGRDRVLTAIKPPGTPL